jgi:ADP-ribose pyrophosphatase YjhB (NUDIX family)
MNKEVILKNTIIKIVFGEIFYLPPTEVILYEEHGELETEQDNIRLAIRDFLLYALKKRIKSIVFPVVCSSKGKLNYKDIAKIFAEEIAKHIVENSNSHPKEIVLLLKDKKIFRIFSEVVPDHIGYINRKIGLYPIPTVDIIIEVKTKNKKGIVLVKRKNPPYGWALPGGFVEYNESLEQTAIREAMEETNIKVKNLKQFHTYSQPGRDPRFHTITTVFTASADKLPKASSDAEEVVVATKEEILSDKYPLVFDHKRILQDYFSKKL